MRLRGPVILALALLALATGRLGSAAWAQPTVGVGVGTDGRLVYAAGPRGDVVIDFSHAGYGGGGQAIPAVSTRLRVGPGPGDDRARIQAALDLVATLPLDGQGFRGAVLLDPGEYQIADSLRIRRDGVVLRGSGPETGGTVLVATGTSRRALIQVGGSGAPAEIAGSRRAVAEAYVPVGARTLTVDEASGISVGDAVMVERPSTAEWIALLGMDKFPGWRPENRLHWRPGSRDIRWDRVVTAIEGNRITLDAPLTTALDAAYGGGSIYRYNFPGRIARVGVERLRLVSAHDPARPTDEDHAWFGIALDKAQNAWIRQVSAEGFVSSVVDAGPHSKWVTVEDVTATKPVSELGGWRRRVFHTSGQLTLFQRCRSQAGRRDFSVGHAAAGPNVFLDCRSSESVDWSGPVESWASGVLYDNVRVRGDALRLINRDVAGQGVGWAAANSVLWNCEATDVEVQNPPGAYNQAYGCKGTLAGDGAVQDPRAAPNRDFHRGAAVEPRSLYLTQLSERLGPDALGRIETGRLPGSPAEARRLTERETTEFLRREQASIPRSKQPLSIENGRFVINGERAWTDRVNWSWFQAQTPPALAAGFGPAITRFAPGRSGPGLTDELEDVAAAMKPRSAFYQHYGLWYDRRRVNHNFDGSAERRTGDVWAPFMELPWARSGQGQAWDGLSKYDLTRFNPWYFDRVSGFADIADRRGLILYYNTYFQHWLLESRSHYVDFPWRPVNAVQDTGMVDEVPAAESFYDVSHPERRRLHRLYLRKSLDALKNNTNVVFGIDREYTGPLSFVQFWLDTIAEWERDTGRRVFISLEIPKDQMDAILADPVRGRRISAVDFHHWVYRPDGQLFAVRGGIDRAPREQRNDILNSADLTALRTQVTDPAFDGPELTRSPEYGRLVDTLWKTTPAMRYRAWREYRDRYPELVVLTEADGFPALTRGIEAAAPKAERARTRSVRLVSSQDASWAMSDPGRRHLVYSVSGGAAELDLSGDRARYAVTWIDGATASRVPGTTITGGGVVELRPPHLPGDRPWAAWLVRSLVEP